MFQSLQQDRVPALHGRVVVPPLQDALRLDHTGPYSTTILKDSILKGSILKFMLVRDHVAQPHRISKTPPAPRGHLSSTNPAPNRTRAAPCEPCPCTAGCIGHKATRVLPPGCSCPRRRHFATGSTQLVRVAAPVRCPLVQQADTAHTWAQHHGWLAATALRTPEVSRQQGSPQGLHSLLASCTTQVGNLGQGVTEVVEGEKKYK